MTTAEIRIIYENEYLNGYTPEQCAQDGDIGTTDARLLSALIPLVDEVEALRAKCAWLERDLSFLCEGK